MIVIAVCIVFALIGMFQAIEPEASLLRMVGVPLIIWGIVLALATGVGAFFTSGTAVEKYATAQEVATELGLESGKPYNLVIGEPIPGTSGSIRGGLTWTSGDFRPTSSRMIGYRTPDTGYEFNLDKIKYKRGVGGSPSTTTIYLEDAALSTKYASQEVTWSKCNWSIGPIAPLRCTRYVESQQLKLSPEVKGRGLYWIMGEGFYDYAVITLAPDEYDARFGASE